MQQGTTCAPLEVPHATAKRRPGTPQHPKQGTNKPAAQATRGGRTTPGLSCCAGFAEWLRVDDATPRQGAAQQPFPMKSDGDTQDLTHALSRLIQS